MIKNITHEDIMIGQPVEVVVVEKINEIIDLMNLTLNFDAIDAMAKNMYHLVDGEMRQCLYRITTKNYASNPTLLSHLEPKIKTKAGSE